MALYKRGSIWWMSFQHEHQHMQRSTKCKNKRDAEAFERAFRTKLALSEVGLEAKPEVPAFDVAIKEFLDWAASEHRDKPNTVRSYHATATSLKAYFGKTRLDAIEATNVEGFKRWRSSQKARPRTEAKSAEAKRKQKAALKVLAPATINRELATLKMLFNYFIRADIVVRNPVSRVKLFKEENRHLRVVSREEELKYLMAASQPLRDFATIMLDTGMRNDEVARIEKRHVNLAEGYVLVAQGKTKAARRKIPLTSRAAGVLMDRLKKAPSDLIFALPGATGPLTTLKTAHATALRTSKVRHFRLYDLRHTFATRFLEASGDLITLQAILGHSNISMVTRYAHPTDGHKVEAIKRMEERQTLIAAKSKAASA